MSTDWEVDHDRNGKHWFSHDGALRRVEWFWIDTCCIDKTSSAELSEAINSMYRWYAEARICFAYLQDVTGTGKDAVVHQFPNSQWFRRGWTLQELLAPRFVVFCDSDWKILGHKCRLAKDDSNTKRWDCICKQLQFVKQELPLNLNHAIAAKTKIPVSCLRNAELCNGDKIPIAVKMSWMAFRYTTRDEDIAYCLLGLFDINMPLLYGEGKKAFRRLQEEIIRQTNDQSIFAFANSAPLEYDEKSGLQRRISCLATSPGEFHNCDGIKPEYTRGSGAIYNFSQRVLQIRTFARIVWISPRPILIIYLNCALEDREIKIALFPGTNIDRKTYFRDLRTPIKEEVERCPWYWIGQGGYYRAGKFIEVGTILQHESFEDLGTVQLRISAG